MCISHSFIQDSELRHTQHVMCMRKRLTHTHTHTKTHTHTHTVSLHNNKQISLPRFCYLMGYPIHTLRETLARERACRLYVPCMRL